MDTKQLKALAARRYEKREPLNKPGEKATYKTIQLFKDMSFLRRKQMRPEILEKGEFPRCVKCIHYVPHDDTLSLEVFPRCFYGPVPLFKEEADHCGQGEWMMIYGNVLWIYTNSSPGILGEQIR